MSDNSIWIDEKMIIRSKNHFFVPASKKLSDVNKIISDHIRKSKGECSLRVTNHKNIVQKRAAQKLP